MTNKEKEKLQAKWERILAKQGLGNYQPMTDHSGGKMAEVEAEAGSRPSRSMIGGLAYLRGKIDGSDQFMDGHQITKVRKMDRKIPEWALNDKEVRRILLTVFPKMSQDTKIGKSQRKRAGKWMRLIHLYYRMRQPKQIVAKEMRIGQVLLTRWIQKMSYVARGLNVNGKPRRHLSNPPLKSLEKGDEHIKSPLLPTAGISGAGESRTASEVLQMQEDDGL